MVPDSRTREVIIERPEFSAESNDGSSNPSPITLIKEITPPALPPKSPRVQSLDRESTAISPLTVSHFESNGPRRSPSITKPLRPAPPPPVVRIASSRSPNAVAPAKIGGDTEITVSPQPSENRPLADQLLHDSTEVNACFSLWNLHACFFFGFVSFRFSEIICPQLSAYNHLSPAFTTGAHQSFSHPFFLNF